jgi:hypothetical protein
VKLKKDIFIGSIRDMKDVIQIKITNWGTNSRLTNMTNVHTNAASYMDLFTPIILLQVTASCRRTPPQIDCPSGLLQGQVTCVFTARTLDHDENMMSIADHS